MEKTEFPDTYYRRDTYGGKPVDRSRRTHRESVTTKPFVAWDGEGYSTDDGKHHYMLFGGSNGRYVQAETLTFRECFPLLVESQNANNVIFGGDYDIIMMIKDMPWIVRKKLFDGEWTRYGGYLMQWRRRKFFFVKRRSDGKSTILYDVQSFFQCSFVKACREYLGDSPELDAMHAMKLRRDSFTSDDDTVMAYWLSELDYLVRLMDCLRGLLLAVDIKPRGWYGPGAVANRVLNDNGMRDFYNTGIPETIVDLAERAYYGGRFEHFQIGRIDSVTEYDIRSAYPYAISMLPMFDDQWTYQEYPTEVSAFALYFVTWDIPSGKTNMPGPLPWRDNQGRIFFPMKGSGWYWGIEIQHTLVKSFPPDTYTVVEGWIPTINRDVKPFAWIREMYDRRAAMKREGNPAQKALKLAMNSVYGKLAQSVGAQQNKDGTWERPKWHHALWAGWVTANTRAMLYDAVRQNRRHLVAIETDAIFVRKPIDTIPLGEKLGEWERTDIEQILYIQSGVYYALKDDDWKLKTRGVEADKSKPVDQWLEIFSRVPAESVSVAVELRRFGTDIRQPDRFATWYTHTLNTTIPGGFSKRVHLERGCLACYLQLGSFADTRHYLMVPQAMIDSDTRESLPYKFPWRTDTDYEWPDVVRSEALELPEELALSWQ